MEDNDLKKDERFQNIIKDPRYRTYKPQSKKIELDKRFAQILSQKKFSIKEDLFHNEVSSSSDESSSEESDQEELEIDDLEKEVKNCYKENVEETNRIAICNLDWDRINAKDIFVLVNSFKPLDGSVKYVKIYVSEYGKERLKEEIQKGPKELIEKKQVNIKEEKKLKVIGTKKFDVDEDNEFNKNGFIKNKLRQYQINRLKYYYAVVEFDSINTAVEIYTQLDGFEYLNSSILLDLRFIPNDTYFDDEPYDECTVLPDLNFYKAPNFINTALQQTNVRLTWEENNHDLYNKLIKSFDDVEKNKEIDYLDDYLASDTENEEDSFSDYCSENENDKEDKILKYRNLLKELEDEDKKNTKNKKKFDIQIEWEDEKLVQEEDFNEKDSESYKEKQDKRIKYRKSKKYKKYAKELKSKLKSKDSSLDLILMNDKEDKKHFNYNNYVENNDKVNKEKKKEKISKDEFKFDTEDPRFSALYNSPLFNIDPSNPKFKRTKATNEVIQKKIKRK